MFNNVFNCYICGKENPYGICRCNSRSIEPCQSCDWNVGHDCEPEEAEDE